MTQTTYSHIQRWTRPNHYIGDSWYDYYSAGVGQSRDSDALERANFAATLFRLRIVESPDGDGDGGASVIVVRESHWAVGWVEWIAIHESDDAALTVANDIQKRLENYPVIDEDLWSQYEDEECRQVWEDCYNERERAEYLRKHVHKVYPCYGETAYSTLRAAVKGSWYHAGNLLPCPSDLLS
jgi:hypothetical protein